jgi:hypothetical protein
VILDISAASYCRVTISTSYTSSLTTLLPLAVIYTALSRRHSCCRYLSASRYEFHFATFDVSVAGPPDDDAAADYRQSDFRR